MTTQPVWSSATDGTAVAGQPAQRLVLELRRASDLILCRARCLRFAQSRGFPQRLCWEVALAASELAANVLRHAGAGKLTICTIDLPRAGLEVRAEDRGPGFSDPELAFQDGYSEGRYLTPDTAAGERRGLGCGLGAVRRLMDVVSIGNRLQGGAIVVAQKWGEDDTLVERLRKSFKAVP